MRYFLLFLFLLFVHNLQAQNLGLAWAKNIGGPSSDQGYSIAVDDAGNVYTTGSFTGTADFDPGAGVFNLTSKGSDDIFICKLDAAGNFVWAKQQGGSSSDQSLAIALDAAGNVYTTGNFLGTADFDPGAATFNLSGGGSNMFISKLDNDGNFLWAKTLGSSYSGSSNGISLDPSGNVYITGSFYASIVFDPGPGADDTPPNYDIVISKLDAAGNFLWTKNIGGSSADFSYSIAADNFGNVYTTGSFSNTVDFDPGAATFNLTAGNGGDVFVSKLNSSGAFVWAKNMGDSARAYAITVDGSGNVFTTGYFQGSADFDPGNGATILTSPVNDKNIFVSKLDASGNFVWAKNLGGNLSDEGRSIKTDAAGEVYIAGSFMGTSDFDPGPATYNLSSSSTSGDAFITHLDLSGNFVSASRLGGIDASANAKGHSVTADAQSNIYLTGYFSNTVDFDPGFGTFNLTATSTNIFVVKLGTVPKASFDFFRTITSGNWNSVTTWESSSNNVDWHPATVTPDFNAAAITVRTGHTITVTANVTVARTTVTQQGLVVVNPGIDLTVQ